MQETESILIADKVSQSLTVKGRTEKRGRGDTFRDRQTTHCSQLTGSGQSFRVGTQLLHVNHAVSQVLGAVLHLSSLPPSSSSRFSTSSPTSSTKHHSPVQFPGSRAACQAEKLSQRLQSARLAFLLPHSALSGSIKDAFWKLIWMGGTSEGPGAETTGRERGRERGRAEEGKGREE